MICEFKWENWYLLNKEWINVLTVYLDTGTIKTFYEVRHKRMQKSLTEPDEY